MKIVIAMDSYKECLTASEACRAVAQGVRQALPEADCIELPVSDGGDGLLSTIDCDIETVKVTGPLPGMKVEAHIGFKDDIAIIESAQACGLALLPPGQRNPMLTTTVGVGEMITHALGRGCSKIIIGLGGSATNDLGTGMLSAMGMQFLDVSGKILTPCGGSLGKIAQIKGLDAVSKLIGDTQIIAACDVNNPLYGPAGAAAIYAPQKGATPAMVNILDNGARSLSKLIDEDSARRPGAGAAGGLGYALMAVCAGTMQCVAPLELDLLGFDDACNGAELVITGEGSSDRQTLMGKIPAVVMKRASKNGVKTTLLSGKISDEEFLFEAGFCSVKSVSPQSMPLAIAMKKDVATRNLEHAAAQMVALIASWTPG